MMGSLAGNTARSYHEATKHSEENLRRNRHFLDFHNQPRPFKIYSTLEPIPLVRELPPSDVPALEALSLTREGSAPGEGAERIPDFATLSRILYFSAGITRRRPYPGGEMFFRAAPNTGALYHIDLYIVCCELPELAAGVYHFDPHDFALRQLRTGDHRAVLVEASGDEPSIAGAPAIVVSASTYWRNAWKYQARAYRHCFWDAGTLHANLLAVSTIEDLGPRIVMGFADRPVEQLLGLDARKEGALTLVSLGRTSTAPPPIVTVSDLSLETAVLSRTEIDYPAIREIHAASSLATGKEAAAWRAGTCEPQPPPAHGRLFPVHPPAAGELPRESLESVIRRRGSTRTFAQEASISHAQLATILDRANSVLPTDFGGSVCRPLIDLYLIVNAVEGIPAGTYYYHREQGTLELLREGDFRRVAGMLGLFQDLPADAAVNIYCLADLEVALEALGDRGYRAAQLEGGIRGGLMYLAAYAQHVGATGLTFLDDEVINLFSPHAQGKSVMFLTACGRSIRRS